MKSAIYSIQMAFTAFGGWLGWVLGGWDGILIRTDNLCGYRLPDRRHVGHTGKTPVQRGRGQGHL